MTPITIKLLWLKKKLHNNKSGFVLELEASIFQNTSLSLF